MKPISLPAARDATIAARARHAEDNAALARGRERLAASEAELKCLAANDEAAISRRAQRLEKQTREGASGPPPALVPTDAQMATRVTAQRTHDAARRMVASLEAAARESAATLSEAEDELQSAVMAAIGGEADALAAEVEHLRADLKAQEALLAAVREVPNFRPSTAVFRALRDDLNLPVADLGHGGDWDTPVAQLRLRPTPVDASAHWAHRIAQLTTGAADEPTSVTSAAA